MIGQQQRLRPQSRRMDGRFHRRISWPVIRHHRQILAHAHDEIRRQRRNGRGLVHVIQARHRRCHGGMQMHHRPGIRSRLIDGAVHEHFLGWLIAADMLEIQVELGNPHRVEATERGIGRCHQIAVGQFGADIAGTADRIAACEQRGGKLCQQNAQLGLVHSGTPIPNALRKKSRAPKLPLFSARCSAGPLPSA